VAYRIFIYSATAISEISHREMLESLLVAIAKTERQAD